MENEHVIIEDEGLRSGFTQIPNLILRNPELTLGAKVTYGLLLSYAWQKDNCYPSQDRLAADMGAGERSVIIYLQQLTAAGLISIRRRGLGQTNVYVIHRLRSAESALLEVQETAPLEMQNLRANKTQS